MKFESHRKPADKAAKPVRAERRCEEGRVETSERRTMWESLQKNAGRLASFSAIVTSVQLMGCTVEWRTPGRTPDALVADKKVSAELPTLREMLHELEDYYHDPHDVVTPSGFLQEPRSPQVADIHFRRGRTLASREKRTTPEGERTLPELKGFEEHGIPVAELRAFIRDGFPTTWTRASNVRLVELDPKDVPMGYEGFGHAMRGGDVLLEDDRPAHIRILGTEWTAERQARTPFDLSVRLFDILTHELAHTEQGRFASDLTEEQRIEAEWRLMKIVQDPSHPPMHESDTIRQRAGSPRSEYVRSKADEYFAELLTASIATPMLPSFAAFEEDPKYFWQELFAHQLKMRYPASADSQEEQRDRERMVQECVELVTKYFIWHRVTPWELAKKRQDCLRDFRVAYIDKHRKELLSFIKDPIIAALVHEALDDVKVDATQNTVLRFYAAEKTEHVRAEEDDDVFADAYRQLREQDVQNLTDYRLRRVIEVWHDVEHVIVHHKLAKQGIGSGFSWAELVASFRSLAFNLDDLAPEHLPLVRKKLSQIHRHMYDVHGGVRLTTVKKSAKSHTL